MAQIVQTAPNRPGTMTAGGIWIATPFPGRLAPARDGTTGASPAVRPLDPTWWLGEVGDAGKPGSFPGPPGRPKTLLQFWWEGGTCSLPTRKTVSDLRLNCGFNSYLGRCRSKKRHLRCDVQEVFNEATRSKRAIDLRAGVADVVAST